MIKVTVGKVNDGIKVYSTGDIISNLPEVEEDRLVKNGVAEYEYGKEEAPETPPSKLIPDGNVDKVNAYVSTIEDIDLLQKMAAEEESDKNRKTVLEAIYKRAQELADDDDEPDGKESLDIKFDPNDVMQNG